MSYTAEFCVLITIFNGIKNSFRVKCSNILIRGRSNDQINCHEKICRKICTWLKDNKLMIIGGDKGRATCIIEEGKLTKL